MRHAVLGAGGLGGLVGAALARAGQPVLLLMRPPTLAGYPGRLAVESRVLGGFEVAVPAAARLERPVDVLWVTVKASQLEAALPLAPADPLSEAVVVPLLNGIDHVERLRQAYGDRVLPGAMRVEAERAGAGRILQPTPFAAIDVAAPDHLREQAGRLVAEVAATGLGCTLRSSAAEVLWGKLALLAPLALGTAAGACPMGEARGRPELLALMTACAREACAVAAPEGVRLDPQRLEQTLLGVPGEMRSSLQKDVEAGRPCELDAIAGPILRRADRLGLPAPATAELRRRVEARLQAA